VLRVQNRAPRPWYWQSLTALQSWTVCRSVRASSKTGWNQGGVCIMRRTYDGNEWSFAKLTRSRWCPQGIYWRSPRAPISTGERCFSGSAFAPRIQRRSTGSECKSLCCLPKYCLCGSSPRRSDTGSPNTRFLCRSRSSRTTEPVRLPRVLGRSLPMQDQPQPPKSRVSSSFKLHAVLSKTPRRLSLFHYIRGRSPSVGSCFTTTVEATTHVTIVLG